MKKAYELLGELAEFRAEYKKSPIRSFLGDLSMSIQSMIAYIEQLEAQNNDLKERHDELFIELYGSCRCAKNREDG